MDNEMSDLESKKLNSSSYEYDHSDWPVLKLVMLS